MKKNAPPAFGASNCGFQILKKTTHLNIAMLVALASTIASASANLIIDGGFEQAGAIGSKPFVEQYPITLVQSGSNPIVGWQTTEPSQLLEVWTTGFMGHPAAKGTYFAELNATAFSTLFQVVQLNYASPVSYSLAHRGRLGADTMDLKVYDMGSSTSWLPGQGSQVYSQRITDGNTSWGFYGNSNMFTPTPGNYYAFTFESVEVAEIPWAAIGNFLDDVQFGYDIAQPVPEPGQVAASLLLLAGLGGYVFLRRRKLAKAAVAA